jgi:hypothetical protein
MNVIPSLSDSLQRDSDKTTSLRSRRSLDSGKKNQNAREEQRKMNTKLHDIAKDTASSRYKDLKTTEALSKTGKNERTAEEMNTAEGPASEKKREGEGKVGETWRACMARRGHFIVRRLMLCRCVN